MRRNIWKPDPDVIAELIQEYPGGVEAFIQKALKLIKTKEQRRRLIELLQQDGDEDKE